MALQGDSDKFENNSWSIVYTERNNSCSQNPYFFCTLFYVAPESIQYIYDAQFQNLKNILKNL